MVYKHRGVYCPCLEDEYCRTKDLHKNVVTKHSLIGLKMGRVSSKQGHIGHNTTMFGGCVSTLKSNLVYLALLKIMVLFLGLI